MTELRTAQVEGDTRYFEFTPHRLPLTGVADDAHDFASTEIPAWSVGESEEFEAEEVESTAD